METVLRTLLLLLLAIPCAAAHAEPTIITVHGQGWHLFVDAPSLTSSDSKSIKGRFRYTGLDVNSGITLSVHTEPMRAGSREQCRDAYWSKTKNIPYIVNGSPALFEAPELVGVTYRSEGEFRGKPFTTANAHGYFVVEGNCVDLHVSQIPYSDDGKAKVEAIVRSAKVMR